MIAGDRLEKPCNNSYHGSGIRGTFHPPTEFDPNCQTCAVRVMLSEHDHLHLGGEPCPTPGENVRCKCGSYHH